MLRFGLERGGFWLMWRGDEVHYVLPGKRGYGKWMSIGLERLSFRTLQGLSDFWQAVYVTHGLPARYLTRVEPPLNWLERLVERVLP